MREKRNTLRQRGSSLAEFIYTVPILLLLGLGSVQAGLIYHGKTTVNYAAFEAARHGAVNHALIGEIKSELTYRLAPIYGGDGTTAKAAQAIAHSKAASLLPARTNVRILNPTPEAFNDWGEMSLEDGVKAIPNSHLRNRNAERYTVGSQSGVNLHDANLLKIKVTHGFEMKIPIVGAIIAKGMIVADPPNTHYYLQNQIPLTSVVTVRMQNEAWEQDWEAGVTPPGVTTAGTTTEGTTTGSSTGTATAATTGTTTTGTATGTTTETTNGTTTGTTPEEPTEEPTNDVQCDTRWEDARYQGSTSTRWWSVERWSDDISAAAAIVWDFLEGALAGMGDQVTELWTLLQDPSVLWDVAKAFISDPKGTLTQLVEGLGEDVQRVLQCGPKDIGQVIGQNVNPVAIVKIIGKLGTITGNRKLTDYSDDLDRRFVCASFPAQTLVWMPNGRVSIDSLLIDDIVLARSDENFNDQQQSITITHNRFAEGYQRIRTESGFIDATKEHPFWVQGKGWIEAKDIQWEDPIATVNGDVVVYDNNYVEKQIEVFNLTVANTHTYFVGDMGAWVHNADCKVTFVSKDRFEELTYDPDTGSITRGSIEELRAVYAAEIGGMLSPVKRRGTRGADFELEDGTLIDVKAPRADYLVNRRQLLKLKGELLAEPNMKILIDKRSLTDVELEAVLQRADAAGISRDVFVIPELEDFGNIKVDGVNR